MKRIFLSLSILILVTLACDLSVAAAPATSTPVPEPANTLAPAVETATQVPVVPVTPLPTAAPPSTTPAVQPPSGNTPVTLGRLSLEIPAEVADGASGKDVPRFDAEDAATWQKTPGHLEVSLADYYALQGKFHQPQIYVYPALDYAVMVPGAFESMHRLNNIFADSASIRSDQLPGVPFFNAAQVFASNIQLISFQNGKGMRFLTEYAQYAAPVNNHELFYHFQGLTDDGLYYIVAILPVTAPLLAETSDPGAALPAGGIALPDINDPNADWAGYYAAVADLLDTTSPEAFTPAIGELDALVQSMRVSP